MLQRPRNRQGGRGSRGQQNRGGRGGGPSNRGGGGRPQNHGNDARAPGWREAHVNVPTFQQVTLGASVSIVLKMDQGTGREVQGFVAEVLTAGDHPRGIKVRLRDGRVGRVQRLVTEEEATAGSEGLSNLGRNGEPLGGSGDGARIQFAASGSASTARVGRFTSRYTDFRIDEGAQEPPSNTNSLEAYIKPPRGQKNRAVNSTAESPGPGTGQQSGAPVATCPVCNAFEGDEAAVAHHVEQHFATGD